MAIPDSLTHEGDIIWVGVSGGTAFEDFLGAEQNDLTLSGSVAYETADGYIVEYAPTLIGETNPVEATVIRIGYAITQKPGLRIHAGVSQLKNGVNAYGAWADALKELTVDRYVRVLADYDSNSGAVGLSVGYLLAL